MSCPGRFLCAHGSRIISYIGILVTVSLFAPEADGQEVLYGMNDVGQIPGGPDEIVQVNSTTGVAERRHVFSSSDKELESLAYDARNNVLWITNNDVLQRVDASTFATTVIGPVNFPDIDGLAIQPSTGVLFGITYGGNDLIRIDKLDASALLVNGHVEEGSRLEDLAFDTNGRLFILTSSALVEVNPSNGNRISKVKLSGATSLEALVWDRSQGTFLSAADRGNFKDLVRINQFTGQVTFLSATQHSGFKDIEALAFVPGVPIVPVQMQALGVWRDEQGAHLRWEAREDGATFVVQRALQNEGPWQEVVRVEQPESGRAGAWRYESVDAAAALGDLAGRDLVYRVGAQDSEGAWSWIRFEAASSAPRAAVLQPNHPNPFNPSTAFEVRLAASSRIEVTLYDVRGHRVRQLRSGTLGAGTHALVWDGRDAQGRVLPAGIYPWVLSAGGQKLRGSAVLVK